MRISGFIGDYSETKVIFLELFGNPFSILACIYMNDLILLVYFVFRLAESRCFCNMLSPFANSCSVAMKFPLFTEKST